MKKIWFLFSISIVAIGVVSGVWYFRASRYEVVHPTRGDITEAVYGLGKVRSNNRFEVIVGVLSTVSQRYANEGDLVQQGKPLITFDNQALFRAPFTGTVTYARLYPGETALPHVPILRLEDLRQRYIELSLEQQSILRVKVGQPAKVSFESLRGKVLNGKVSAIFPREDEFLARVQVEDLDASILPGMTADVTIEIGSIANALLIPLKAVRSGMVSVKRSGKWQKVKVEIDHIDGLRAELKGNSLTTDDEIRFRSGN